MRPRPTWWSMTSLGERLLQQTRRPAELGRTASDSRAMPRLLRTGVLCLVVLVAGCQSSADPTTTVVPATTTTPLDEIAEPQVYEMLALASHSNGMQLRVDRVELLADSVVVSGSVTNGSPYGISLDGGTTQARHRQRRGRRDPRRPTEGPHSPRWGTALDPPFRPGLKKPLCRDARSEFRRRIVNGEPVDGVPLGAVGTYSA